MTLQCLASLQAQTDIQFQVLVWDNGSRDETVEAIGERFPRVLTHYSPTNLGVAAGRNAAADLAIGAFQPSYLLFLDNDMMLEPEFVSSLVKRLEGNRQVGQVQAKLRFMYDPSRLNDGGGARINYLLWQSSPVGYNEIDRGQYDTVKKCIACGGAMMVRTDLFQRLHGFDTTFNPFGPEDLDFSLRLQQAGYLALYVPDAVAYHVVSHTYGQGYNEAYARHKSRHWFLFMRRHASPIQQAGFFLLGMPYLAFRTLIREGRKGNMAAIRGLMQGLLDLLNSPSSAEKHRHHT
jgi:GT2 family glycosyltransferase